MVWAVWVGGRSCPRRRSKTSRGRCGGTRACAPLVRPPPPLIQTLLSFRLLQPLPGSLALALFLLALCPSRARARAHVPLWNVAAPLRRSLRPFARQRTRGSGARPLSAPSLPALVVRALCLRALRLAYPARVAGRAAGRSAPRLAVDPARRLDWQGVGGGRGGGPGAGRSGRAEGKLRDAAKWRGKIRSASPRALWAVP